MSSEVGRKWVESVGRWALALILYATGHCYSKPDTASLVASHIDYDHIGSLMSPASPSIRIPVPAWQGVQETKSSSSFPDRVE